MAFDFEARAEARRLKAEEEQREKDKAEAAADSEAEELRTKFESYAKNKRARRALRSERDGALVTFSDGPKLMQIRVVRPGIFDTAKNRVGSSSMPVPKKKRIEDEEGLMDFLDDWTAEN